MDKPRQYPCEGIQPQPAHMASQRLLSLDILRGLTVMLMIFVNNGAGEQIFSTLRHSQWNGMTPCDLVFPFFLFIMGISTYLSLRKSHFEWSAKTGRKIARRTATLFLLGLFINWFDMACSRNPFDMAHLRIMGVMQRIGLCYGATALLAIGAPRLLTSLRGIAGLVVALLGTYAAIILIGGGYHYDASTNVLAIVDTHILGHAHLYHKSPVDPEGLLSTLPAIAHTLIGFGMAALVLDKSKAQSSPTLLERVLLTGAVLVFVGYLFSFAMPLNKRIWSPSYVLTTCGAASLALGILVFLIDTRPDTASGASHSNHPAQTVTLVFGTNPLFLYLASEIIGIAFGASGIKDSVYNALHTIIADGYWASATYAGLFVLLHILLGYPLWKRQIYIKI